MTFNAHNYNVSKLILEFASESFICQQAQNDYYIIQDPGLDELI